MPAPIIFYFDFSSPYGYLASTQIDALAAKHGREVDWRPFLLGAVFKISGMKPLLDVPIKGEYTKHDFARSARFFGVSFVMPPNFPFAAVAASRAVYWLKDRDKDAGKRLAKIVYHAAFGVGRDITAAETVAELAAPLGIDRATLLAALNDPAVKDRLKTEVDGAIQAGVFGSPFIIVDGEPFWGADRLAQVDKWLTTGGW